MMEVTGIDQVDKIGRAVEDTDERSVDTLGDIHPKSELLAIAGAECSQALSDRHIAGSVSVGGNTGEVDVDCQRAVAAVNLAGLGSNILGGDQIRIDSLVIRFNRVGIASAGLESLGQHIGIGELDRVGRRYIGALDRRGQGTGLITRLVILSIGGSNIEESVKAADGLALVPCSSVGDGQLKVLGLELDVAAVISSGERDRGLGTEPLIECFILVERQTVGIDNVNHLFADVVAVKDRSDGDIADLIGSGENAVLEGAAGDLIGQPGGSHNNRIVLVIRHRADIDRGAGGDILCLGSIVNISDLVLDLRGGRDDHTVGDRTGRSVGRTVDDLSGLLAGHTRHEGGGTAAVTVERANTARLDHDLSQLVHRAAAGEGLLTTVQNCLDDLAVSGNAEHGTAVAVGVVGTGSGSGHIFAVPYELGRGAKRVDRLFDAGVSHVGVPFINRVADDRTAVVQDRKEHRAARVLRPCLLDLAVHDKTAAGLAGGHVVAVAVGCGYDRIVLADELGILRIRELGVRRTDLLGQLGHAVGVALHVLV